MEFTFTHNPSHEKHTHIDTGSFTWKPKGRK